jgi:hypothetical protein
MDGRPWLIALALLAAPASAGAAAIAAAAPVRLDAFESVDGWKAMPSDGVEMKLSIGPGAHGRALRVDFRFVKGGGYAVLHRDLAFDLPPNYRFTWALRGESPTNNLEFKLVDSTGANVWWCDRRDYEFPGAWHTVITRRRQIQFAWGPAGGGELRHVAAIEFAITAGSGGSGTVWLDDLALEPLPPVPAAPPAIRASASSARPGHGAGRAADGDPATLWRSARGDRRPWLALDLQAEREYGGLAIEWAPGGHPGDYAVEASEDGHAWRTVREVRDGRRERDVLFLPESESRWVRVRATRVGGGMAIREVTLLPLEAAATRAAFFERLAKQGPRGSFPRGMSGEQCYWTVVSVDGGRHKGLLGEDGAIETGRGAFSIEPFLRFDGRLFGWADVTAAPSLADGDLPVPSVVWSGAGVELTVTACAVGTPDASSILATYAVRNPGSRARPVTLYLAIRPFQVNPPAQFLNQPGGVAPVRSLVRDGASVRVNGDRLVRCVTPPAGFGAETYDQGDIVDDLRVARLPRAQRVEDPFEAASGALAFDLELPPGGERDVVIETPLEPVPGPAGRPPTADEAAARVRATIAAWRERLAMPAISVPDPPVTSALRAQVGWMLANRVGPALEPGPRAYARTWIRDGALMSAALLRTGHADVVKDFIEWFAPYQYADGKVPCCVDARGSDPVPEHDSHGEFLFLVGDYVRMTGDTALARRLWPRLHAATGYLDSLRAQRLGPAWETPEQAPYRGILPPSISHEGYSAKPMHSYWDDLWALRGYREAEDLATRLSLTAEAGHLDSAWSGLGRDLGLSMRAAMKAHHIEYVPGSADLGDFDPTSTTIAFDPVEAPGWIPREALTNTFERYWTFFRDRRYGREPWDAYTPYEMRSIGTFVRLGWRVRADSLLTFFLGDQRPRGWQQWPEVVWRDARAPHFLGDLPHAWVGSDFVRSALDLFGYAAGGTIQLGAGIPERWVRQGDGVAVQGLRTPWGSLGYRMRARGRGIEIEIDPGASPIGGFWVWAPGVTRAWRARVNGRATRVEADGVLRVRKAPATILLTPP